MTYFEVLCSVDAILAPPPGVAGPSAMADALSTRRLRELGIITDRGKVTQSSVESPAEARSWRVREGELEGFGAESPIPGRETEYKAVMAQQGAGQPASAAQQAAQPAEQPAGQPGKRPPIDDERRSRSPGLQNNFFDVSTDDFKKPHQ